MATYPWLRWHIGTVTDPKFRVVAARSEQPVYVVLAVWAAMLEAASDGEPRGTLSSWDDEDAATAIGAQTIAVKAVREAMQGKLLDGLTLTGWSKRQPKKEDPTAAERKARSRAGSQSDAFPGDGHATSHHVTPRHAASRRVTTEEKRREEIRIEEKDIPPLPPLRTAATGPKPKAEPPVEEMDVNDAIADIWAAELSSHENSTAEAAPTRNRTSGHKNGPSDDALFLEFWATYPRKVGKPQAAKAWAAAIKRGASSGEIIAGARRYAAERQGKDQAYTAHPTTWLNRDGWADEIAAAPKTAAQAMDEKYEQLLREARGEYEQRSEPDYPGPCIDGDWTS